MQCLEQCLPLSMGSIMVVIIPRERSSVSHIEAHEPTGQKRLALLLCDGLKPWLHTLASVGNHSAPVPIINAALQGHLRSLETSCMGLCSLQVSGFWGTGPAIDSPSPPVTFRLFPDSAVGIKQCSRTWRPWRWRLSTCSCSWTKPRWSCRKSLKPGGQRRPPACRYSWPAMPLATLDYALLLLPGGRRGSSGGPGTHAPRSCQRKKSGSFNSQLLAHEASTYLTDKEYKGSAAPCSLALVPVT